jgi:D-glycero-alpha-D-manno-heptose 1-phosphate guanylyltransferase
MKLLVLAGGFGTRLQSVLSEVPKAMAPVGNLPFLLLQIWNWKNQGVNSFVFLLHHRADLIIRFLQKEQQNGELRDCEVQWLVEPTPLDTGGAVAFAIEQLSLTGNFLVANADTWLNSGIADVTQVKAPAMAVVALPDAARYGRVKFNMQQIVTTFQEKDSKNRSAGWINAGLYRLNVDSFLGWNHLSFSLERFTFPAMVESRQLCAVPIQSEFIDIGIPEDYFRFCRWIDSERKGNL